MGAEREFWLLIINLIIAKSKKLVLIYSNAKNQKSDYTYHIIEN